MRTESRRTYNQRLCGPKFYYEQYSIHLECVAIGNCESSKARVKFDSFIDCSTTECYKLSKQELIH